MYTVLIRTDVDPDEEKQGHRFQNDFELDYTGSGRAFSSSLSSFEAEQTLSGKEEADDGAITYVFFNWFFSLFYFFFVELPPHTSTNHNPIIFHLILY